MSATEPALTIIAASVQGGELRVEHELVNRTGQRIYVFNLITDKYGQLDPPPRAEVSPECCQVSYAGDATVELLHGITEMPADEGMDYYAPLRPLCSRIEAGARYRATIRCLLPLAEYSVYDAPVRDDPEMERRMIDTVRLSVDYFLEADRDWGAARDDLPGAHEAAGSDERRITVEARLSEPVPMVT